MFDTSSVASVVEQPATMERTAAADQSSAAERVLAARNALARAELAAGLRTRLDGGVGFGGAAGRAGVRFEIPAAHSSTPSGGLPLPAGLGALFPGGFHPGAAISLQGSASIAHTLAAAAMGEQGWAAVVGGQDIGWVAAAEAGLDLSRTAVIPNAGAAAGNVVAACVDGFSVVLLGDIELSAGERRSLLGRIRANGTILIAAHWPGVPMLRAHVRGGEISADGVKDRVIAVTRDHTTVVVRMGQVVAAELTVANASDTAATPAVTGRHLRAVS